jgi:cytochrome c-type biogenesis protein
MEPSGVSIGMAALAGLASFLSPCVLALVPAYVGYLGGVSVQGPAGVVRSRWAIFAHGLAFVFGFSIIFIALGALASGIGALLYDLRAWITRIGGVIVFIFGLHTTGLISIPFLNYDTRRQAPVDPSLGYLGSILMGVFFSAGWTPCVGPVLGAVLTLALNSAQLSQGILLLSAYSAGLAIPFLLAALGVGFVAELLRRHARVVRIISLVMGIMLMILGAVLFFGAFNWLARIRLPFTLGI